MSEITTLAFIGDVMLGRGVNEEILRQRAASKASFSAAACWGDVLPILTGTNAVFANLECAITTHLQPFHRRTKLFHFRADPAAIAVLQAANIQCVSLANNHSLDFEEKGLLDTLHYLDAAHIYHAGAGHTLQAAIAPAILRVGNVTLAFIALTDNEASFAAERDRPGTYYLEIAPNPNILSHIAARVEQARAAGAEFVVLSVHWGPNMVIAPTQRFQDFAHAVMELGVDLLYGHSAHLFQAIECYHNHIILYNTGDFLDDYAVDPVLRNDWSFIFLVNLNSDKAYQLKLIPVRLHYAQVELAKGEEFTKICTRMRSLCRKFNTPISDIADGLEVQLHH